MSRASRTAAFFFCCVLFATCQATPTVELDDPIPQNILDTAAASAAAELLPSGVVPGNVVVEQAPQGQGPDEDFDSNFATTYVVRDQSGQIVGGLISVNSTMMNRLVRLYTRVHGGSPSSVILEKIYQILYWHEFYHLPESVSGLASSAINDPCKELSLHIKTLEQLCALLAEGGHSTDDEGFLKNFIHELYRKITSSDDPSLDDCRGPNGENAGAAGPDDYGIPYEIEDCSEDQGQGS